MSPESGHNPATPVPSGVEQDVSRVIADVESQLLRLKEAEAQRRQFVVEMERREKALEERERALAEQARQVEAGLVERERQVRELNAKLEAQRAEWEAEQQRLEERARIREAEVRELHTRTETQRAEWIEEQKRQDQRAQAREQEFRALQERLDAQKSEVAREQSQIEAKATELRTLRENLESHQSDLAAQLEKSRAQNDHALGQLSDAKAKIDQLHQQLDQRQGDAAEQHRAVLDQLQATTTERDRLAAELQHKSDSAGEHQAVVEQLKAISVERDRLVAELRQHVEASGDQEALAHQLNALAAERDHLASQLKKHAEQSGDRQKLAEQVRLVSEERDRLALELEGKSDGGGDSEELSELREQIQRLHHEREILAHELSSLRGQTVSVTGKSRPMPPERVASRMRRLRACRGVVSARARKLRRAGEVLQQRVEQCDLLLQQRRELAAAKRALDELHKRVQSARARNTTSVQIGMWIVTLVALAALSWVVAGRYAPASYAAKAIIAAENIDSGVAGSGGLGDPVAWTEFHVELLSHPRLIERVAGRLQRRGMNDMATVDAVRTMIETSLTHREPEVGRLELELVAEGKLRTQRLLETYMTALVAEANESRPRRRDGLATVIKQEAVVADEPVADPRPKFAGIGLVIAAGVAAILWFGLWGAMSKVRARYEASSRLDEILDEARWVDPVPDVARRPGAR